MKETKRIRALKELNLADRFLFDEVVEELQTHQDISDRDI